MSNWGKSEGVRQSGDLLDRFFITGAPEFDRWRDTRRTQLRNAAVMAAHTLLARSIALGDAGDVILWARRVLQLAPFDEHAARHLISALEHVGDRAGALRAHKQFERRGVETFPLRHSDATQTRVDGSQALA